MQGEGLRRRWARAAMIALLASGIFFASGTEGKLVSFLGRRQSFQRVDVWRQCARVCDIDGDGDLDAFIGITGRFRYYVNNGSGVFTTDRAWNSGTKAGNPLTESMWVV
jgi:hypothetical protein